MAVELQARFMASKRRQSRSIKVCLAEQRRKYCTWSWRRWGAAGIEAMCRLGLNSANERQVLALTGKAEAVLVWLPESV